MLDITHYLLFRPLEALALQLSEMEMYEAATQCWQRVTLAAEILHPEAHHEKIIYYDHYAQVLLANDNVLEAHRQWRTAYELSLSVCGVGVPETASLLRLVENAPRSKHDMMMHYSHYTR